MGIINCTEMAKQEQAYGVPNSSDIWNSLRKTCINFFVITLSQGTMKFSMFLIVLMKNTSLSLHLDMNAEYTPCG